MAMIEDESLGTYAIPSALVPTKVVEYAKLFLMGLCSALFAITLAIKTESSGVRLFEEDYATAPIEVLSSNHPAQPINGVLESDL